MITTTSKILGLFGYAKIPKEVVQLSLLQERRIESILSELTNPNNISFFKKLLEGQRLLTKFLWTGRLVNHK
jgi:hypothetical protein